MLKLGRIKDVLYVRRPVDEKYKISSPFGLRKDPLNPKLKQFHKGIDFAVPVGTTVKAMCDGEIFRAGYEDEKDSKKGFGNRIWQSSKIDSVTYYLWYGHLSEILVKEGDYVKEGQVIGSSGNTGRTSGPHLHVQCRVKNTDKFLDMGFYVPGGNV